MQMLTPVLANTDNQQEKSKISAISSLCSLDRSGSRNRRWSCRFLGVRSGGAGLRSRRLQRWAENQACGCSPPPWLLPPG